MWTASLAALWLGLAAAAPLNAQGAVIPDGLSVGGRNLGGLDTEDAKQKLEDYVADMSGQTVSLDVEGVRVETTAGELGYSWKNPDVVEESVKEYNTGNVIQRYMKQKDLQR